MVSAVGDGADLVIGFRTRACRVIYHGLFKKWELISCAPHGRIILFRLEKAACFQTAVESSSLKRGSTTSR